MKKKNRLLLFEEFLKESSLDPSMLSPVPEDLAKKFMDVVGLPNSHMEIVQLGATDSTMGYYQMLDDDAVMLTMNVKHKESGKVANMHLKFTNYGFVIDDLAGELSDKSVGLEDMDEYFMDFNTMIRNLSVGNVAWVSLEQRISQELIG